MTARIKILTSVYVLVLAVLIFLADKRTTQFLFKPIRNLPYGDKIGHFFLMGFFSFLVNLALSARSVKVWKFNYLLGSLIVLTIVAIEEFSQIFVRGRTFDWGDLAADFAGIFIFGELARFICQRKRNLREDSTT